MFGYFTLIFNGSCYSVALLQLFTDLNYYNNNYEFTCKLILKGQPLDSSNQSQTVN